MFGDNFSIRELTCLKTPIMIRNRFEDCPKMTIELHPRDCLEGVGNNAFTAYSNFYTHTQNMCFFLESQVWHEETEDKIRRLSEASSEAAEAIDAAARDGPNLTSPHQSIAIRI